MKSATYPGIHKMKFWFAILSGITCLTTSTLPAAVPPKDWNWMIEVEFSQKVRQKPYTGRVYLFCSKTRTEPRKGVSWFKPELILAQDVTNWGPGQTILFSAMRDYKNPTLCYPKMPTESELGSYYVQAVARFNPVARKAATGAGNGYSQSLKFPGTKSMPVLKIDKIINSAPLPETKWGKELRVRSKLLSDFHQREVYIQAAVMLPKSYYEEPDRRYPTIYQVPGFGGTHRIGKILQPISEQNAEGVEFLRVFLDPSCPLGHSVFANSANNGPWGDALVQEFIPALEEKFRCVPDASARFLTGHSSGGWSTLWLQVRYPDSFGGTWSTAPDPVDFRNFQEINMYTDKNMYRDENDERRPLAIINGKVTLWYDAFDRMETVLGYGGQLHSFEAVFSPRNADGTPALAWDRKTGSIDHAVAEKWKPYDIRLLLENNWKELEPKLRGKLTVIIGSEDTFLLTGATRLLKTSLEKLGSDAKVEIVPGKTHFNLIDRNLSARFRREMTVAYLKHHQADGTLKTKPVSTSP